MASAGTYNETNGLGVYREVNRRGSHVTWAQQMRLPAKERQGRE